MYFKLVILIVSITIASCVKPSSNRKIKLPKDTEGQIEDFFLLSLDHPTKISFRPSQSTDYKIEGTIERLNSNGSVKSVCTFPAFGFESASYQLKFRSLDDNLEVFQVMKIFEDPKNNSMDIFVMDMKDCKHTKSVILKGYDYLKNGGSFIVVRPG